MRKSLHTAGQRAEQYFHVRGRQAGVFQVACRDYSRAELERTRELELVPEVVPCGGGVLSPVLASEH